MLNRFLWDAVKGRESINALTNDGAVQRTIEQLCEAWMRATDADAVGELADELAKRALDVRDPDDVARLCSAIVARLNGSHATTTTRLPPCSTR